MKKYLFIVLLTLLSPTLRAQDNTWEQPEEDEMEKTEKVNPNAKYLQGAVPEVDGKVVFQKTISTPGKTADEIYAIVKRYMTRMTHEKNQVQSQIVLDDSLNHIIAGTYGEWLVFKSSALALDRTKMMFVLTAKCQTGQADITMSRIHYLYDEECKPLRYKAEEWITDKQAVNKKNTRLLPISGKFRKKTIDRKDFLFSKFETLLNK